MTFERLIELLSGFNVSVTQEELKLALKQMGYKLADIQDGDVTEEFVSYLKDFLPQSNLAVALTSAVSNGLPFGIDDYVDASLEEIRVLEETLGNLDSLLTEKRVKVLAPFFNAQLTGEWSDQEQQLKALVIEKTNEIRKRTQQTIPELRARMGL